MKKSILHLLRLTGFSLALALLLSLFHLLVIGLPGPLTRKITARLQDNGIPIHIQSISLSARREWVLHGVQVYSPNPDDLEPILHAKKLYLTIWPEQWRSIPDTKWNIGLHGKEIGISLGQDWDALDSARPFRNINRLQARLQADPSGFSLHHAEIEWGGFILHAEGQAAFQDRKPAKPSSLYSTLQNRAPQVVRLLNSLSFETPPQIHIRFDLSEGTLEQAKLNTTFFGSGLRFKGRHYDHLTGTLKMLDGMLHLDPLQLTRKNEHRLTLSARYDLSLETALLNVSNTLPVTDLLVLLPENITDKIARTGIELPGTAEFDAVLGPCPAKELAEQIRMQVHKLQIGHEELLFDPLSFDLARDGSRLAVTNMEAQVNGGSLSGRFEMDLESSAWSASLQGRVAPSLISRRLGGPAQSWIDRCAFNDRFPDASVELSRGEEKGTFQMRASVSGQDILCEGVPLDTLDITMTYSNRTFALPRLQAARGDKTLSGDIRIDLDRRLAFFNAVNEFSPVEIAHILAPDHPTVLTNLTFTGPLTSTASGQIDYSGGTNHAAQGTLHSKTVSAKKLTADSFQSRIEARGDQLIFSDTSMKLFDGLVKGSAVFDLQFNDEKSPYRLDLTATQLNLNQLSRFLSTDDPRNVQGLISASLDVTADVKAGFWPSAKGSGEVEVEDGQLHDLPVLGGFSRLIRTTLPGFSIFSITTLYSEYELHDGALHTDNMQFGGTLLSAHGQGNYSPEKGLDFSLKAEPLRQTREDKKWYQIHLWGAEILKQSTALLFSLLEFRVTGDPKNPSWDLVYLPNEIAALFQSPPQPDKTTDHKSTDPSP